jgi:hypothetical protein
MANTRNIKKNVWASKPGRRSHAETAEKIPVQKSKMRSESKQATLIKLLERSGGASIDEMTEATGWQRHSIRGMMSGELKKRLGLSVASEKEERGRIYRIVG